MTTILQLKHVNYSAKKFAQLKFTKITAGSSTRLVRPKPQGPGPDRGPDCPVQKNSREKICSLVKNFAKRHLDPPSRSATIFTP